MHAHEDEEFIYQSDQGFTFHVASPNSGVAFITIRNALLSWQRTMGFESSTPLTVGRYEFEDLVPGIYPYMRFNDFAPFENPRGYFEILELERSASGAIDKLAVNFLVGTGEVEQSRKPPYVHFVYSEYDQGWLRFNSSIPIPEPSTFWLGIAAVGCAWGEVFRVR